MARRSSSKGLDLHEYIEFIEMSPEDSGQEDISCLPGSYTHLRTFIKIVALIYFTVARILNAIQCEAISLSTRLATSAHQLKGKVIRSGFILSLTFN